jgi:hypothetical protein
VSYESVPFQDILEVINDELRNVALRNTASVLRRRDFDGLSSFSLESMVDELKTLCPVVFRVLSEILELSYNREKKIAPLCLIYGVVMFKRCHELSFLQRINTVLLADSNANTEVK